jgi:hypothetical protein
MLPGAEFRQVVSCLPKFAAAFIKLQKRLFHPLRMKAFFLKIASFLASLIATDHDERMYNDF